MTCAVFLLAAVKLVGVTGGELTTRAYFDVNNAKVGDPLVLTIDFVGDADFTALHPPALSRHVPKEDWKVDDLSAKTVKIKVPDKPSGNGRTAKQTMTEAQIRDLLNKGYTPGSKTQLATSTMQLCLSRIQMAINARWSQVNPRIGAEGYVLIAVRFNSAGQMVNCRLSESCGDKTSDSAALTVVRSVGPIAGLDKEFLREFGKQDLVIRYKVESR